MSAFTGRAAPGSTARSGARRRWLQAAAAALASPALVRAQSSSAALVLGHTYPASGIFAATAAEMKAAIDAAVAAANADGGIGGRPLRVVSLDDGYDPARSLANAERLRAEHGALALLAPVGAPNLAALMPWAESRQVPLVGARSGADAQRARHRFVFFVIASFGDEVRHITRHLQTLGARRVAVAAMDNPTGHDIEGRFAESAQAHQLEVALKLRFNLTGRDAEPLASRIAQTRPEALVLAGGGEGAIALCRHLLDKGLPASAMYGMSLLQPLHVHRSLGERAHGIVFAQVTPRLDDPRLRVAGSYREALSRLPGTPPPTAFGFEGYLAAQVALRGLARAGPNPSGAALAEAITRLGRFDLGGLTLQYDATSHHGTRYVDLGILTRGQVLR